MRRMLLAAAACAALISAPVGSTFGQEGEPVRADKDGWWNRTTGLSSGTPAAGFVPPVVLPETVPEGAIGIAAVGGEAQKVAAVGIVLDAPRGSAVERLVLTLQEAEGPGAQQNAEGAVIVACPIIDFFAGVENGSFADAPEADCELASVTGERDADGTWTFDLAPIADRWLDPFGTVAANGIRLDPGDATFQVSLTGAEDATFDVAITEAVAETDPFDSTPTSIAGGFGDSSSTPGGGSGSFDVSAPPAVDVDRDGSTATATTVAGSSDGEQQAASLPKPSRAGDVAGNLPLGAHLAALAAIVLAVLVSLHLGASRAVTSTVRAGRGVSRALAARSPGGPA